MQESVWTAAEFAVARTVDRSAWMVSMAAVSAVYIALAALKSASARTRLAVASAVAAVLSNAEAFAGMRASRDVAAVVMSWAVTGVTVRVTAAGALR